MNTAHGMPGGGLRASEPAPVTDDAPSRAGRLLRWYPAAPAAGSGARDRQVRASLVSLGCAVAVQAVRGSRGTLAGCSCWVATGGQRSLFHAGLIDVAGVTMMALALWIAQQAARTARIGLMFAER